MKWNYRKEILLFSSLLLFFFIGVFVGRKHLIGLALKPIKINVAALKAHLKTIGVKPEHLTINIKYMDYQKLAYKRKQAFETGNLFRSPDDYVPALIRHEDKTYKVKLRLKGDHVDHFDTDQWSFRIKVQGDNVIFGMKEFSIQHPKTRNYIYEWLFHYALKREGLLSLRYKFIKCTINAKYSGVYALEEHFNRNLIEFNKLRNGPVVRFNEDIFWHELTRYKKIGMENFVHRKEYLEYLSSHVDAFNKNELFSDPLLFSQYQKAINLLEAFRSGLLETSQVFDISKLAKYFAIIDLFGAWHAGIWINMRFYYNPITSRLEPIGFDGDAGDQIEILSAKQKLPDYGRFFEDIVFYREYMKELERISKKEYLDVFYEDVKEELDRNLKIIYKGFPFYEVISIDSPYNNGEVIAAMLHPKKGLHAYFKKSSQNKIEISVGNIQPIPIEVLSLSYKNRILCNLEKPMILNPPKPPKPTEYTDLAFSTPYKFNSSHSFINDLEVNYRLLGTSPIRSENVFAWSFISDDFLIDDLIRQKPNVETFEFASLDRENGNIIIKPGNWTLDESLIIPHGYKVICQEKTRLNLTNSSVIVSFSPLEFIGTKDNPINICSDDATGQGVVVMSSGLKSTLEYVNFKNLSNPERSGWKLTGAVTFYESPVDIKHCQFLNSRSEDSLNILLSDFFLSECFFEKSFSDAFDADFSSGEIIHSSFTNCGNDAIDISGSDVVINNVFINGAEDKGMSIGEDSKMKAERVEIRNATTAVASKDESKTVIEKVKLFNCRIGFNVFQKKPEFGPASMIVMQSNLDEIEIPYLVQEKSKLKIDDRVVKPNQKKSYINK